jgi:2,3-bisphosphoglycerate-independent phosphoglycerate mutase
VPAVLVAKDFEAHQLHSGGALSDVAPTLLKLLGLDQPAVMDGKSLIFE